MGKPSRDKGKRGELDARDHVRKYWRSPDCIRAAQRDGRHGADLLKALDTGHVEVKRHAAIAAVRFLEQAERDMVNAGGEGLDGPNYAVVLMREDKGGWVVMLRIEDSGKFAKDIGGRFQ